jgi:hypothetical protein
MIILIKNVQNFQIFLNNAELKIIIIMYLLLLCLFYYLFLNKLYVIYTKEQLIRGTQHNYISM